MRWVVDAMNVIGSRPDGWWRDREGAARRFVERMRAFASQTGDEVTVVLDAGPREPEGTPGGALDAVPCELKGTARGALDAVPRELKGTAGGALDAGPGEPAGGSGVVHVVIASRRGRDAADDEIARLAREDAAPATLCVVTSDRALAARVRASGAEVEGAGAFRGRLEP